MAVSSNSMAPRPFSFSTYIHPNDSLRNAFIDLHSRHPVGVTREQWVDFAEKINRVFAMAMESPAVDSREKARRNLRLILQEVGRIDPAARLIFQSLEALAHPPGSLALRRRAEAAQASGEEHAAKRARGEVNPNEDLESLETDSSFATVHENVIAPWVSDWLDENSLASFALVSKKVNNRVMKFRIEEKMRHPYMGDLQRLNEITSRRQIEVHLLKLGGNRFCDRPEQVEALLRFTRVQKLDLSTPRRTGRSLTGVEEAAFQRIYRQFIGLKELTLNHCRHLTLNTWSDLGTLTQLEKLRLKGTKINAAQLRFLRPLTRLEELDIGNTSVRDNTNGLPHLASLTNLCYLDLSDNELTGRGVPDLQLLTNLHTLLLRGNYNMKSTLQQLPLLPLLEVLDLSNLGPGIVPIPWNRFSNLRALALNGSYMDSENRELVRQVATGLSSLQALSITSFGERLIETDRLTRLTGLRWLFLSQYSPYEVHALHFLPSLRTLHLGQAVHPTDYSRDLPVLMQCAQLREVFFRYSITEDSAELQGPIQILRRAGIACSDDLCQRHRGLSPSVAFLPNLELS